jgi:Apoptosis regulator proteins, Bcl-2 family
MTFVTPMSKFVASLFSRNADTTGAVVTGNTVQHIARELAADTVKSFTQTSVPSPPNEHAKTLRRTVEEISCRHEILFSSMVRRLTESVANEPNATLGISFQRIADELFRDGHINWGRIVTVYAFAGWLARHAATHSVANGIAEDSVDGNTDRIPNASEEISRLCGDYVAEKLSDWILQQGGWVSSFCVILY